MCRACAITRSRHVKIERFGPTRRHNQQGTTAEYVPGNRLPYSVIVMRGKTNSPALVAANAVGSNRPSPLDGGRSHSGGPECMPTFGLRTQQRHSQASGWWTSRSAADCAAPNVASSMLCVCLRLQGAGRRWQGAHQAASMKRNVHGLDGALVTAADALRREMNAKVEVMHTSCCATSAGAALPPARRLSRLSSCWRKRWMQWCNNLRNPLRQLPVPPRLNWADVLKSEGAIPPIAVRFKSMHRLY